VEVKMIDALAGLGPMVDREPIAVLADAPLAGDAVGGIDHPVQELGVLRSQV